LNFEPQTLNLPSWWLEAALIWLALLGAILWFLGVKLVRSVIGLLGLVGGAVLASAFVQARFPDAVVWPWTIAGAAMFGVTGWIMWRLLVAVMLGGTVALLMLAAVMLWSDIPPPPPPVWEEITEADETPETESGAEDEASGARAFIESAAADVAEAWRGWWNSLEQTHQWLLMGGALGAGTLALLVGLALPRLSSAMITALLGVLLITPGLHRWLPMLGETVAAWMPRDGRQYLLVLIAATLIGAFIQWAFFRKSADK
jgi:hypothetical protein